MTHEELQEPLLPPLHPEAPLKVGLVLKGQNSNFSEGLQGVSKAEDKFISKTTGKKANVNPYPVRRHLHNTSSHTPAHCTPPSSVAGLIAIFQISVFVKADLPDPLWDRNDYHPYFIKDEIEA